MQDFDVLESQSGFVEGPRARSGKADESALDSASDPGVMVDALEPGTRIVVATKHSCYRLVVIDGGQKRVSVTGGKVFPESTEACVEGATTGDQVIKPGCIAVGLRMELSIGLKRITTTCVQSVSVESAKSAA